MSKKFKLFASVAAPFVSLPLMLQPAAAAPPRAMIETVGKGDVIRVQERLIPPDAASEGDEQPEEAPERAPRAQREEAPEPAPRAQREAPAEVEAEEPAPKRRVETRQERQPETEPEKAPAETRQRNRERAPAAEEPADAAPATRPSSENGSATEQAPAADRAPASEEREQAPASADDQPARNTRSTKDAAPTTKEGARSTRESPSRRSTSEPSKSSSEEKSTDTPSANEAPAPADATEGRSRTAPSGGAGEAPDADAPRRETGSAPKREPKRTDEPSRAATPEGVERARRTAEDPGAAREEEQPVLPVENGAAVLDSAKEQPRQRRDGERPRRQNPDRAEQQLAPPKSDAEAQSNTRLSREQEEQVRALIDERGERLDGRPQFERPRGWDFREESRRDGSRDRNGGRDRDRDGGRTIFSIDNQTFVRHDDSRRFYVDGREPQYDRLRDGRIREVVERDDGTRIITIRNRYGEIVQRSRVRDGQEYVLYYAPDLLDERRGPDYVWRDPGDDLPPMRLAVPIENYIIDTSSEPDRDYYEFLEQPPVERVERVYTLDEVRYSARIRDKVPRIDLDTITFATGSAEIPMNQASSLRRVAEAINKVLDDDPSETFLIEGHTDAVGSDESNLILSDERAESVARVLTDAFGVPPENLTTQGYGERYLKVRTEAPNQDNRRVTIRRITPLVKPVASNR